MPRILLSEVVADQLILNLRSCEMGRCEDADEINHRLDGTHWLGLELIIYRNSCSLEERKGDQPERIPVP